MRNAIVLLIVCGQMCQSVRSQTANPSNEPDLSRTVLVTLTTRGLSLSHTRVKPGKIRFLLDNRTPRRSADLQVSTAGAAGAARMPKASRRNRMTFDTTLSPGTYIVGIHGIRESRLR
jgi:hypothetical protein